MKGALTTMKYRIFLSLAAAFFMLSLPVYGENERSDDTLIFHYTFEKPVVHEYDHLTYVQMAGCMAMGDGGKPIVPVKSVYLLLPQGKTAASVQVAGRKSVSLGDGYEMMLGKYPLRDGRTVTAPMPRFDSSRPFPVDNHQVVDTYGMRGFEILVVNLYPLHYIAETGEIYYFTEMTITVHLRDTPPNPLFRGLARDYERVAQMVENPEILGTYDAGGVEKTPSLTDSSEEYAYVIITSSSLAHALGQNTFEDLAEFKGQFGLNATVVTVEDIEKNAAYWNTTPRFNDTQAKLRRFITDAYLNWHTDYVLLAGDVDIVPVRNMWVEGEFERWYSVPSDVYYACLDGSYNSDGDLQWGEPTDGDDGGDVDLMAEVYVGRASVGSTDEMRTFVSKTMTYESAYDSYVPKVVFAGEDLGWGGEAKWGGNHLDQLVDVCEEDGYTTTGFPSDRYTITKLYDRDRDYSWQREDIIALINEEQHIICHDGHSNYFYNMRMSINDVDALSNEKHFFAYSNGCMAGGFDATDDDCFAEYMTVKTPHGAFAGIWNTRYGWGAGQDPPYDIIDYGSQRFAREFWDAIFGERIKELGRANQDSKEDNIWRINELVMRFCFYEITLFGDPAAILKDVDFHAPEKPAMPAGEANGKINVVYAYESETTDEDGDMLYYLWDFGDGTQRWSGPHASGEKTGASHTWSRKGTYQVRVKAKDMYGRESEWSDPLPVSMPLFHTMPLLEKLIEWLYTIRCFHREWWKAF